MLRSGRRVRLPRHRPDDRPVVSASTFPTSSIRHADTTPVSLTRSTTARTLGLEGPSIDGWEITQRVTGSGYPPALGFSVSSQHEYRLECTPAMHDFGGAVRHHWFEARRLPGSTLPIVRPGTWFASWRSRADTARPRCAGDRTDGVRGAPCAVRMTSIAPSLRGSHRHRRCPVASTSHRTSCRQRASDTHHRTPLGWHDDDAHEVSLGYRSPDANRHGGPGRVDDPRSSGVYFDVEPWPFGVLVSEPDGWSVAVVVADGFEVEAEGVEPERREVARAVLRELLRLVSAPRTRARCDSWTTRTSFRVGTMNARCCSPVAWRE